jgi:hypothetical protein
VKLTKRGKRVVIAVIVAVAVCVLWLANDALTPDACKVPVDQMSSQCKDLLFP